MILLSKIYTRGGDRGSTALGDGRRVSKTHPRVVAYGSVDELNALIGVARARLAESSRAEPLMEIDAALSRIQNDLFDVGADLCVPAPSPREALRVSSAQTERLEREIDVMNADLEPLRSFVLPGGSPLSADLHAARTSCRRAERALAALMESGESGEGGESGESRGNGDEDVDLGVHEEALRYVNRLSDHLFVSARLANRAVGTPEPLWEAGANR